jgi:hypothetical protein
MKCEFPINTRRHFTRVLLVIVLLILLSQILGSNPTSLQRSRNVPVPEAHKERIARRIAAGYGLGPFQPSLEMKEHVDFLLTPALLVQEAISEDIIITYPTE